MRLFWLLNILAWGAVACTASPAPLPTIEPPPTALPISNEAGEVVATQNEAAWVLVSGVDEHGLIVEHDLPLLEIPDADSLMGGYIVHTGTPAAVREIRHTGPGGLQRFYYIETIHGAEGWISDFYIRRLAYVYAETADSVALHAAPEGEVLAELPNVSPIRLLDPKDTTWWQVETSDGSMRGWVAVEYVKESPQQEFLQNQQHNHEPNEP